MLVHQAEKRKESLTGSAFRSENREERQGNCVGLNGFFLGKASRPNSRTAFLKKGLKNKRGND
jgi:hypothetical protein